jgi:hypothetical protein
VVTPVVVVSQRRGCEEIADQMLDITRVVWQRKRKMMPLFVSGCSLVTSIAFYSGFRQTAEGAPEGR